jgi:diguanylate cyclase (GGDEF)-like protein
MVMSKEKLPKILSHGAVAAGGIAVGYFLRESKTKRAGEHLAAARVETSAALELASHDPLTGLANRRGFDEQYQKLCTAIRGNRQGDPRKGSLLMLDLDHFKLVNDTHGHLEGDSVLRTVADTITGQVREDDTVARLGGEEMGVLLPNASAADAVQVAEKIRAAIKDGSEVTVSIGVAAIDADQPAQSIEYADAAVYRAKENGRDQVVELSPPLISAAVH